MILVTGDTHGVFDRIYNLCDRVNLTNNDTLIVVDIPSLVDYSH